jgi:hypothetical protein
MLYPTLTAILYRKRKVYHITRLRGQAAWFQSALRAEARSDRQAFLR